MIRLFPEVDLLHQRSFGHRGSAVVFAPYASEVMSRESVGAEKILNTRADIFDAILGLDGALLHRELSDYHERHGNDSLVADVLIPVLRQVGDMWECGKLGVLHEHHASNIIRSVVGTFRRPAFDDGTASTVILACPPGELHDLPNHLFSLMLLERGLAPIVLGANTPWKALAAAVRSTDCAACVVSGINPRKIGRHKAVLSTLNGVSPVFLAGRLAALEVPGVRTLSDDWRHAASAVDAAASLPRPTESVDRSSPVG
jgi:MerR family transcriptional regulator, light-induced transcriptional regulator